MHKKNLLRGLAVTGAATAATLGMAASAIAGPPFTITVGGNTSGTYSIAGDSTAAISFHAGVDMTCSSVHFDGTVTAGSTSAAIASLTGSSWNGCKGPLNIDMSVQQVGTWEVDGISGPASGVTTGQVNNIDAIVTDTSSGGGLCSFEVTGSAPGTFTNGTQILAVNATSLTVSNVSGCFGLVTSPGSFSGNFAVTNPGTGSTWPVIVS